MKLSGPNTSSAASESPTPTSELTCVGSLSHWPKKITTSSAVMAKLRPLASTLRNVPKTPPNVQPTTQYSWFRMVMKNMNQPRSTPSGACVA